MIGPIGMSEEKDEAQMAQEQALVDAGHHHGGADDVEGIVPQMKATPGMPVRQAVARRQERVRRDPAHAAARRRSIAIQESLDEIRRTAVGYDYDTRQTTGHPRIPRRTIDNAHRGQGTRTGWGVPRSSAACDRSTAR